MSSICVGVIERRKIGKEFKINLARFVEESGRGIVFNTYYHPLIERINGDEFLTFDLTDFPNYQNCEDLISDYWEENKEYRVPLEERMVFISNVLNHCLISVNKMELYIGDFDAYIDDFLVFEITPSEFVKVILPLYKNNDYTPCVHFYVKRESALKLK